ncbi:hypothetical protein PV10_03886 [Exophiala mesophila]|uniref:Cyclin-domain-containing protein n=1 Tax=Exophiala mesophila TaxID=212818 RepID=A0A0D1ZD61_EXOME|nr:uncharacterized protein PV10_03886 [Exophiala mesophila]KIV92612.1 hypothetical protein PV10_03886 [Exophiala mesophila]
MLATSPSPNLPSKHLDAAALHPSFSPRPHHLPPPPQPQYDYCNKPSRSALTQNDLNKTYYLPSDGSLYNLHRTFSTRSLDRYIEPAQPRVKMVDASTQYSPPDIKPVATSNKTPTSTIAGLHLTDPNENFSKKASSSPPANQGRLSRQASTAEASKIPVQEPGPVQTKRQAVDPAPKPSPAINGAHSEDESPVKKARPDAPPVRMMPIMYENCNVRDLVVLISSMLMELIRYNDAIPLREGHLTRFHSRAPPGISVLDYLQRLTTHATLSPPILLSMVYYIDRLCALYPAFTISSLTVHRFLITSATVASKGLSDSFWTNKTYARVGGVSMKELALLELEFLTRMEWRIVPKPEVLRDYYKSLIERNSQYQLEP